mmetsp:Transcript_12707/g.25457  ORF Transcript_12707/g.25457 Transcript_12707/m.25457 type:complete len:229 (+) Transcript_12707:4583-5269(+)
MVFSLVPTSALTISLILKEMNVPPDSSDEVPSKIGFFNSLATALAKSVFPHPGGPYNRTPVGGESPNFDNISLLPRSKASASSNDTFAWTLPPIDAKCDGKSSSFSLGNSSASGEFSICAESITFLFTRAIAFTKSCTVASSLSSLLFLSYLELFIKIHFNCFATRRKTLPLIHGAVPAICARRPIADASNVIPSRANAASKAESMVLVVSSGIRYRSLTMQSRIVDP